MAGRVRFVMDPRFERTLMTSPAVRDLIQGYTEQVAAEARTRAPFLQGFLEEGIEPVVEFDGSRGRFVGRVISHDFKTLWKEFGTKHESAQPFLRPALTKVLPRARTSGR